MQGTNQVLLSSGTYQEFGNHQWNTEYQNCHNIDDDECPTTVLSGLVGEAPDIAQSDCRTGGYHHCSESGAEISALPSLDCFHCRFF